jgi:NTE family protein
VIEDNSAGSPVDRIPGDTDQPQEGKALCLSGGGYRAMLFHLGTLWRLNEFGMLSQLDRVSSVSGGSIIAAMLALRWNSLAFDQKGVSREFERQVAAPIRNLAMRTIDTGSIVRGALLPGTIGGNVAAAYRKHLFGEATLQDITDKPRFVINATNVQSKALWRFSKAYMRDWRVGEVLNPKIDLGVAVAASSAFPPFLSPVELELDNSLFTPGSGFDLQKPPFTTQVVLTDGGVYDNLGLETAWKRYQTILVSDGGGMYDAEPDPKRDWAHHTFRVFNLIDNQVRSLRKRQVIESFRRKERSGAYWSVWTDIRDFKLTDCLDCPFEKTRELANTPTRLKGISDELQERLINLGYAMCDASMRAFGGASNASRPKYPYTRGLG